MKKKHKDETILNHDDFQDRHGAVVPPIYQNSLFTFEKWDDIDEAFNHKAEAFIYSRIMNPTVAIAEAKIAALCRAEKAKLCASGIAAVSSAILSCVNAGDHIIVVKDVYGPTNNFINRYLGQKFNIESSFIDGSEISNFENAIRSNTKLIYLESPSSLKFTLQDLGAVALLAKSKGIYTVIDNTWATPLFQKPLSLGIDLEVHSVSKYLCGHSDVVAGVVAGSQKLVDRIILAEHELLGAKMAPFEGWLILRSLRTLHLRMRAHMANTSALCDYLSHHQKVAKVYYPGLESHPQHTLAKKQMTGFSGLFSFELKTKEIDKVKTFVNTLSIFKLGVSWGGHDSLVYAPVISYLKELPKDKFEAMGIHPGLIRLSVGLEHIEDLVEDLDQALNLID